MFFGLSVLKKINCVAWKFWKPVEFPTVTIGISCLVFSLLGVLNQTLAPYDLILGNCKPQIQDCVHNVNGIPALHFLQYFM